MVSITLEQVFNPTRKRLVTPGTFVPPRGVNVFKIHCMNFSKN